MINRRRDAVQFWAASAIAVGLALCVWAVIASTPAMPAQDKPVAGALTPWPTFAGTPSPSPSSTLAAVVSYKPLYPKRPRYAAKIGTITLPTLHLSWPIFEGTTDAQLARGVGHYRLSVLPGENNNAVLSGHRSTVFNRLGELHKNNLIYVKTSAGIFTYRVRSFRIVKRTNRTVIVPTKSAILTLTTCWPFNHIGATTQAFVVSADLVASKLGAK